MDLRNGFCLCGDRKPQGHNGFSSLQIRSNNNEGTTKPTVTHRWQKSDFFLRTKYRRLFCQSACPRRNDNSEYSNTLPGWKGCQKDFWPQLCIVFLRQRVPGKWILSLKVSETTGSASQNFQITDTVLLYHAVKEILRVFLKCTAHPPAFLIRVSETASCLFLMPAQSHQDKFAGTTHYCSEEAAEDAGVFAPTWSLTWGVF